MRRFRVLNSDTTDGETEHRSDGLRGFSPEVIGELRAVNAALGAGADKEEEKEIAEQK